MIKYHELNNVDYQSAIKEKKEVTVLEFGEYKIVFGVKDINENLFYLKPKSIKNNLLFNKESDAYKFSLPENIYIFDVHKMNVFHKGLFFSIMRIKKDLKSNKENLSKNERKTLLLSEFFMDYIFNSQSFLMIEIDENSYIVLKNKSKDIQYIYYLNFNNKSFISYENIAKNKNLNKENIFKFLAEKSSYFDLKVLLQLI